MGLHFSLENHFYFPIFQHQQKFFTIQPQRIELFYLLFSAELLHMFFTNLGVLVSLFLVNVQMRCFYVHFNNLLTVATRPFWCKMRKCDFFRKVLRCVLRLRKKCWRCLMREFRNKQCGNTPPLETRNTAGQPTMSNHKRPYGTVHNKEITSGWAWCLCELGDDQMEWQWFPLFADVLPSWCHHTCVDFSGRSKKLHFFFSQVWIYLQTLT